MDYVLHVLTIVLIYALASAALDVVSGYAGLLSVAHAALFGVGAYAVGILELRAGLPFWLGLIGAILAPALVAAVLSWCSMRTQGDYFLLSTFALQVIASSAMVNLTNVTGGPAGLAGIPRPRIGSIELDDEGAICLLVGVIAIVAFVLLHICVSSSFGRLLRAIRDDEGLVESFGKPVLRLKGEAFLVSASAAGLAGGLYAMYVTYIDPSSFAIGESVLLLGAVVIGGGGRLLGAAVGAAILVILPELLRLVGLPSAIAGNARQILFGGALVLLLMIRARRPARVRGVE